MSPGEKGGESIEVDEDGDRAKVSTKVVTTPVLVIKFVFGKGWYCPLILPKLRSMSTHDEEEELVEFSFCIINIEEGLLHEKL